MANRPPPESPASARRRRSRLEADPWPPGARAILDAAVDLFATDGFDSVSIAAIADKAGVSKANVFHHFASKGELYFAVMQQACTAHANFAEELRALPIASTCKIRQLIEFEIRFQDANLNHIKMTTRELLDGHPRVKKLARDTLERNFSAVTDLIRQGMERGEFSAELDPAGAAMLVQSTTGFYFMTRHVLGEIRDAAPLADPAVYAEQIAALVLKAICV